MSNKIKIIEILNGHINVTLGINSELSDYRIENACKKCKVSHNEKGQFTNRCLKENGGCNCILTAKASLPDASCPKKIWFNETIDYDMLKKYEK
jgi:hypothetical protein